MDHTKFAALANRLINANGRAINMLKMSAIPADSAKPWDGPAAPTVATSTPTMGCFVDIATMLGSKMVPEDMLKRVEQVVLIPPGAVEFLDYNVVEDGGQRWRIEWIERLKPGAVTTLYFAGVKR